MSGSDRQGADQRRPLQETSAERSPDLPVKDPNDRTRAKCPICGSPVVQAFRPFCSKRCADVDLGRWLNGSYAIAGRPEDEQDGLPTFDRERAPDSGDDGY